MSQKSISYCGHSGVRYPIRARETCDRREVLLGNGNILIDSLSLVGIDRPDAQLIVNLSKP